MSLADWLLPSEGRLSADDLKLLSRVGSLLPQSWRAALLQPARPEARALPRFEALPSRRWDLRFRSAARFDLLVAARLPGFMPDEPQFSNALASCQALAVLDSGATVVANPPALAEMVVVGGRLRLYRGELTDPLLRVDDYPTGVRPILEDLTSLHDVLSRIDEAGLPFHLGIVPALLDERMVSFLRGLQRLVVSMHGFEHGYAKHSKILLDAGDPFNQHGTVSGFDEFAGQSYPEILQKIRDGKQILESRLGRAVRSYIPPCNAGNRSTGRALMAVGFEYVLTEKAIPGCKLPLIGSDFYDRTSAFKPDFRPHVASLHATWEADMTRAGDPRSLPTFLAALVAQREQARGVVASVAERMQGALGRG